MINDIYLKFSTHRALLGNVTANMRAVIIGYGNELVFFRFVFYGSSDETDKERMGYILTEVLADFKYLEVNHDELVAPTADEQVLLKDMPNMEIAFMHLRYD